jgi:hypothetical protein
MQILNPNVYFYRTYQEGLLSNRRLIFTNDQIYYNCHNGLSSESLNVQISNLNSRESKLAETFDPSRYQSSTMQFISFSEKRFALDPWTIHNCISRYSSRSLSFAGDILNGILGIIRAMERQSKMRHLWGIPFRLHAPVSTPVVSSDMPTFFDGLGWISYETKERRPEFPSWSWTGWVMPRGCPCVYQPKPATLPNHSVSTRGAEPKVQVLLQSGQVLTWEDVQKASLHSSIDVRDLKKMIYISTYVTPLNVVVGGTHWGSTFEPEISILWNDGSWSPLSWPATKEIVISELSESILGVHLAESSEYIMLIIRDMGECWERIGICKFTKKEDGVEVLKEWKEIAIG